jgi:hypothetical protein
MLSRQSSILLYGHDRPLLETRIQVLELSGARIWVATNLAGFDQIIAVVAIDLVVLCHTLTQEECDAALVITNLYRPQVRSLLLISGLRGCQRGSAEQVVDTASGPGNLLRTVEHIIEVPPAENFPAAMFV